MILITGANGFVGSRAMEHFRDAAAFPSDMIRSADKKQIAAYVEMMHPDLIIHTAAISDIGTCEKAPEASYQANVLAPVALAEAVRESGAKLVCFSSDQVYTGCADEGPYRDDVPLPEPANVYARHKLEAEKRVLDLLPDAVMLRATWMYDAPKYGHANRGNFLVNMLSMVMKGQRQSFSRTSFRGITYVRQVAELLDGAAKLPGGAYNYGSENPLSMYETARALLLELGLEHQAEELIEAADQDGQNLWMDCERIKKQGILFDTTAEGFRRCVKDYNLKV